jgi:hypothetical protein
VCTTAADSVCTTAVEFEISVGSSDDQISNEEPADEEATSQYENDLMMLSIQKKLLPLILKEEVLQTDFWTMVDSGLVESTMNEVVSDIRRHQDDTLSEILGTLKKYGVPLDDTRGHRSLLKDLYSLSKNNMAQRLFNVISGTTRCRLLSLYLHAKILQE